MILSTTGCCLLRNEGDRINPGNRPAQKVDTIPLINKDTKVKTGNILSGDVLTGVASTGEIEK